MHVGEILATKTKEDAEKRKQLHELKAEMEREMKVIFSPVYNLPYTGLCSLTYLDYSWVCCYIIVFDVMNSVSCSGDPRVSMHLS